jgi:hypothetical protein
VAAHAERDDRETPPDVRATERDADLLPVGAPRRVHETNPGYGEGEDES